MCERSLAFGKKISLRRAIGAYAVYSCQEEDVTLTDNAMSVLTSMAVQTTLRYALNLIATAQVLAQKRKSERVDVEDLRRAYTYFMDEKRSVQWLKEQQGALMFEEVAPVDRDEGMDQS
jgi:RuvB-like protein 2